MAQGAGRLGTAFIIPTILWIQTSYGIGAVFASVAVVLLIAALTVNLIGPEFARRGAGRARATGGVARGIT